MREGSAMKHLKQYTTPSVSFVDIETESLLADSNFVNSTIIFIGLYSEDEDEMDPQDAL